ncbi:MAG: rRNA pseudouridine synthase [Treponema sp.]|nr:rRNA pseudouridine synthase [Treponema sp.]
MNFRGKNIRLHVYLAHAGVSSRRAAEEIISQGRVTVNGTAVTGQGYKVNDGDVVLLDGKSVLPESRSLYLVLNKPQGYICSSHDPQGRPLALDLLSSQYKERLYSVGRLDFLSCGLILFTNDGAFASLLVHPASGIEKEYFVEAAGPISDAAVEAFINGITIEGVQYKAKTAERTGRKTMRITLIEGKNREIRRVFSHFHLHPNILRRVRIGPVVLGGLQEGKARPLTEKEIADFRASPHSPIQSSQKRSNTW